MEYNLIDMIVNLGFSVAIAGYLVWWITRSLNGKLNRLTKSIDELKESIDRLTEVVKYGRK